VLRQHPDWRSVLPPTVVAYSLPLLRVGLLLFCQYWLGLVGVRLRADSWIAALVLPWVEGMPCATWFAPTPSAAWAFLGC
jgi:hypothetical protein